MTRTSALARAARLMALFVSLALAAPAGATTFTVDDSTDTNSGSTCTSPCSLRQAINAANADSTADRIEFNLDTSGVQTITPAVTLPAITQPVTIDGTTEPDDTGLTGPRIELNGAQAFNGVGLNVAGPNVTIKGLIVNRFKNAAAVLVGSGATSTSIYANYIGTNAAGTACSSGAIDYGNGAGIAVNAGSNTIGGGSPLDRNIIACNRGSTLGYGVAIGYNGSHAGLSANYIGVLANGTAGPNTVGVRVVGTLGHVGLGEPNVISGNTTDGIQFLADGATLPTGNTVSGNFIGTDPSGTAPLPNGGHGISVIGGNNTVSGNVIGGNGADGVHVGAGPASSPNTVSGNNIGVGPSGAVGSGGGVGSGAPGGVAIANGGNGVTIDSGTVTPGANANVSGNRIANNGGSGVRVPFAGVGGQDPTGNRLANNVFASNGALAIDLGDLGPGVNDTHDSDAGPNGQQNYPVLTSALPSGGGSATLNGTLASTPSTSYTLELYVSASCDPSGMGEGERPDGPSATAVVTDASGNATFSRLLTIPAATGEFVTATVTDPSGNTSEMSRCVRIAGKPVVTTNPATGVTTGAATMNATVNPNSQAATAHFEYGPDTGYGSSTSDQAVGSDAGDHAVSATVSALAAGTTFHYRVVSTNGQGTTTGEDRTFVTATPDTGGTPPSQTGTPGTGTPQTGTPDTGTPQTGPTPPPTAAPHCVVPKLKGKTLRAAKKALLKAHCRVGKVTKKKARKKGQRRGTVISTKPGVGARRPNGAKVNLVVAR